MRRAPPTLAQAREKAKAAQKRKAVKALKRAKSDALKEGVELSAWEGEFLGSLEERLTTFGRAFADPEKGAPGASLSALQTRKLKEIKAKIQDKSLAADKDLGPCAPDGAQIPATGTRRARLRFSARPTRS